jgi:uncharacterized repeat protein (TIGR03803 family)
VLYNFTGGSDGGTPQSNLIFDGVGNLYGTTSGGGLFGYGTVFELSPNGSGGWNETVLHSFTGGADGVNPTYSPVIFDGVGNLYGTAYSGGANGYGVVFELSPAGASWTENVLYSFANAPDGANPINGLIMDPSGNLYGRTFRGGKGNGVVFELSPSGSGWTEQVIYASTTEANGSGLAMDRWGNIFGTTYSTVFELSPNGHGWDHTVIYHFGKGTNPNGTPVVIFYAETWSDMLFGTAEFGGGNRKGTVYRLWDVEVKNGEWYGKTLYSFKGGEDGGAPCRWPPWDL